MNVSAGNITSLNEGEVFVFGSNEAGIHGAGAAKLALNFGAELGIGVGLVGQTYAIPSKDMNIKSLPLSKIKKYIQEFTKHAREHPENKYLVTEIGCGLAGFTPAQIAPFFKESSALTNVYLPQRFWNILNEKNESNLSPTKEKKVL